MGSRGKDCQRHCCSTSCTPVKVAMRQIWGKLFCLCMACVAGLGPQHTYARTGASQDQPVISIESEAAQGSPAPSRSEMTMPPLRAPGFSNAPERPIQSQANAEQAEEIAKLRARALAPSPATGRASPQQASAAWLLGLLYLHGIGVSLNRAEAENWFVRAETQGDTLAAAGLAWCEIEGCSRAPNPVAARRWISRLRASNPSRALYLQWLLETRMAPLQLAVPSDRSGMQATGSAARQLLVRAAAGGDVQARVELGLALAEANRLAEALEQFRAAAPGSQAAASNVELMQNRLQNRPQMPVGEARQADAGPAVAADTLAKARRNHRGDGQPANYVEAIRLYRMAQSQGSVEARKMLELIFSRPGPDGAIDTQWMQQLANINLGSKTLQLDSAPERRLLLREPTALSDLLPTQWRRQLKQNQVGG